MSDVYFIIVPVVVVVVILNLCLIFWRVWLYQKRREQQMLYYRQQQQCLAQAVPSARVVRVERCVGPQGYAQRTSYAINRPGQPTRQLTRTVVIRAARDEREDDPNLPPTYDQAVTGKDRSVKVEEGAGAKPPGQPSQGTATAPPQGPPPPSAPGPIPRFAPPPFSQVPRVQPSNTTTSSATRNNMGGFRSYLGNQPAPPNYSQAPPPAPPSAPVISDSRDRSDSLDANDQTALLA